MLGSLAIPPHEDNSTEGERLERRYPFPSTRIRMGLHVNGPSGCFSGRFS